MRGGDFLRRSQLKSIGVRKNPKEKRCDASQRLTGIFQGAPGILMARNLNFPATMKCKNNRNLFKRKGRRKLT